VWDVEGRKYLDFLSAYSALNFGYNHPELVAVLLEQSKRLAVCSRAFHAEELCLFSKEICGFCGFESVLPMNTGTEAIETALKISRKWGAEVRGVPPERARILVMADNFHGRSITVISFSTEAEYRNGFGPYTPGFDIVPFADAGALEKACSENTIAVLLEPIQAEAGIRVPPPGYLAAVRRICDKKRALLILDEIQTGLGRTGRDFCFEHEGIRPDILVLGKSLGGGLVPISAVLTSRSVMDVIRPGQHGSTFGGNSLACAVARRALRLLRAENLSGRARQIGETMLTRLKTHRFSMVKEIRGMGALVGIELKPEAGGARSYCEVLAKKGVLCKETHHHVLRVAPPLIISDQDLHTGLDAIIEVLARNTGPYPAESTPKT
jgi:ornithine--oxo-acid transaminase